MALRSKQNKNAVNHTPHYGVTIKKKPGKPEVGEK